jgi:hypothetical protein
MIILIEPRISFHIFILINKRINLIFNALSQFQYLSRLVNRIPNITYKILVIENLLKKGIKTLQNIRIKETNSKYHPCNTHNLLLQTNRWKLPITHSSPSLKRPLYTSHIQVIYRPLIVQSLSTQPTLIIPISHPEVKTSHVMIHHHHYTHQL